MKRGLKVIGLSAPPNFKISLDEKRIERLHHPTLQFPT
jgi:hypothetical protein